MRRRVRWWLFCRLGIGSPSRLLGEAMQRSMAEVLAAYEIDREKIIG